MASVRTGSWGLSSGDVKNRNLCLMLPMSWMGAETAAGWLLPIPVQTSEVAGCFFVCWTSLLLGRKGAAFLHPMGEVKPGFSSSLCSITAT